MKPNENKIDDLFIVLAIYAVVLTAVHLYVY